MPLMHPGSRNAARNLVIALVIVGIYLVYSRLQAPAGPTVPTLVATAPLEVRTPAVTFSTPAPRPVVLADGPCRGANGLPDRRCTPGAIDERVTQANIKQTICRQGGYTDSVRPPASYTDPLKRKLMARYGYTDSTRNYELNHLIPLGLGGHPTSELNLFPEPLKPKPGAYEKDDVETYLHDQVCAGRMTLAAAQEGIRTNWQQYYPVKQ
jgi:hypothetical protein